MALLLDWASSPLATRTSYPPHVLNSKGKSQLRCDDNVTATLRPRKWERKKLYKLGCFVVISILKNTNRRLILARFCLISSSGAGFEASNSNRRFLSLVT